MNLENYKQYQPITEETFHSKSQSCKSVKNNDIYKIKRPPNAYIIYSNENRKNIAKLHPHESNNFISKRLGYEWRKAPEITKSFYRQKATEFDRLHKILYPDYVYSPSVARLQKKNKIDNRLRKKTHRLLAYTSLNDGTTSTLAVTLKEKNYDLGKIKSNESVLTDISNHSPLDQQRFSRNCVKINELMKSKSNIDIFEPNKKYEKPWKMDHNILKNDIEKSCLQLPSSIEPISKKINTEAIHKGHVTPISVQEILNVTNDDEEDKVIDVENISDNITNNIDHIRANNNMLVNQIIDLENENLIPYCPNIWNYLSRINSLRNITPTCPFCFFCYYNNSLK
ncbi:unnamed protein product [Gordionus sp. m RMFG-2023]